MSSERMSLNRFNRLIYPMFFGMPAPTWGGTWCYCRVFKRTHYDKPMYCGRYRSEAKYRRHYRKEHFPA